MNPMTPAEANQNRFLGKTDRTPRPAHDPAKDGPFGPDGRESLRHDQQQWDAARAWDQDEKQRRANYLAGLETKRKAEDQARHDADEARAVDAIRTRYFRADRLATEADFQRDLPEIRRQQRIAAAMQQPDERFAGAAIDMAKYVI